MTAKIHSIESLSAHGDQSDLISWLNALKAPPKQTYLIHGEPQAQEILAEKIFNEKGWFVSIPKLNDIVTLAF